MDYSLKFEKKNEFFLNNFVKNSMDFLNNFSSNANKENIKLDNFFSKYKELKKLYSEVNF